MITQYCKNFLDYYHRIGRFKLFLFTKLRKLVVDDPTYHNMVFTRLVSWKGSECPRGTLVRTALNTGANEILAAAHPIDDKYGEKITPNTHPRRTHLWRRDTFVSIKRRSKIRIVNHAKIN